MAGCFMFQLGGWGGFVFQMGRASFLKGGGGAPWGASILVVGGAFEKNWKMGGAPHAPHYGKPSCDVM